MDELMAMQVELTLTIAELVELIEVGAVCSNTTGYEPKIVSELRGHFARLAGELRDAADEI